MSAGAGSPKPSHHSRHPPHPGARARPGPAGPRGGAPARGEGGLACGACGRARGARGAAVPHVVPRALDLAMRAAGVRVRGNQCALTRCPCLPEAGCLDAHLPAPANRPPPVRPLRPRPRAPRPPPRPAAPRRAMFFAGRTARSSWMHRRAAPTGAAAAPAAATAGSTSNSRGRQRRTSTTFRCTPHRWIDRLGLHWIWRFRAALVTSGSTPRAWADRQTTHALVRLIP